MQAKRNKHWKLAARLLATATLVAAAIHGAGASQDGAANDDKPSSAQLGLRIGVDVQLAQAAAPAVLEADLRLNSAVASQPTHLQASKKTNTTTEPAGPAIDPIKTAAIIPGVFGSVAIPMRNFPVSARWAPVFRAISDCTSTSTCGNEGDAFTALTRNAQGRKFLDKLSTVNRTINRMIAYRKDSVVYGNLDYWAKPTEILSIGAGDCEDFAILKMAALLEVGIPAASMSLVVLQDRQRRVFHAVLSVATQSGTFILDNLSDVVVRDSDRPNYVPLYSFSTDRAWIHGAKPGSDQVAEYSGGVAAVAPGEGSAPDMEVEPVRLASLTDKTDWQLRGSQP